MRAILCLAVAAVLAVVMPRGLFSPRDDAPSSDLKEREEWRAAAVRCVSVCEKNLEEEEHLFRTGAASEGEVDVARYYLAGARHELALCDGKREVVIQQARDMVAIREREWNRLVTVSDPTTALDALAARRCLASARYHLSRMEGDTENAGMHLRSVLDACAAEVRGLQALAERGVITPESVDDALRRQAWARAVLAREEGRREEAVEQLRIVVKLRERDVERHKRVSAEGGSPPAFVEFMDVLLLEDRLCLAVAERKPDDAHEAVGGIVSLLEKITKRWKEVPNRDQVVVTAHEERLARYRLALASKDLKFAGPADVSRLDY
jgi:hypothetical protein